MYTDLNLKYVDVFLEQEDGAEITANSLHPGAITTNLFRHHNFVEGITRLLLLDVL